jgi:hypothetical protein
MSYLRYLCLFAYSGIQHILCCVVCCARLRLVSCVPNVLFSLTFIFYSLTWLMYLGFILLLGILLTFDGLFLLVPIFFIIYLWTASMRQLSDKMKHFKVYQRLIGH